MSRRSDNDNTNEDAAKALVHLSVADVSANDNIDSDAAVAAGPIRTWQNGHDLHLPILPPWESELILGMEMEESAEDAIFDFGDLHQQESEEEEVEVSFPQMITVDHRASEDDDEDPDDDSSLSLYIGTEHHFGGTPIYRDLSNISDADVSDAIINSDIHNDMNRKIMFPVLLHEILSCGKYTDSIAWHSSGRVFVIVNEEKFFAEVCPAYFCTRECELFIQWIEKYGFKKVHYYSWYGATNVAFYHEKFLRSRGWLARTMEPSTIDPIPQSMSCAQEVLWYLDQLPAVQDLPSSLMYYAPVIFQPPQATTAQTKCHFAPIGPSRPTMIPTNNAAAYQTYPYHNSVAAHAAVVSPPCDYNMRHHFGSTTTDWHAWKQNRVAPIMGNSIANENPNSIRMDVSS